MAVKALQPDRARKPSTGAVKLSFKASTKSPRASKKAGAADNEQCEHERVGIPEAA